MDPLPAIDGYALAPDWQPVGRCWLSWPSRLDTWGADFEHVGLTFAAVARAIAEIVPVTIVVPPRYAAQAALQLARRAEILGGTVEDAWLGDLAPLFLRDDSGDAAALCCRFNGWGNRVHDYEGDDSFADWLAKRLGLIRYDCPLTLEAGAISGDGQGTPLAARDVLLNANRNPTLDQRQVEDLLALYLGIRKVIWLDGAPLGHVGDGQLVPLARFVAPGRIACADADAGHPWRRLLADNRATLADATDALGRPLELIDVAMPAAAGQVAGGGGLASYLGYRVVNDCVLMPVYGGRGDEAAAQTLSALFAGAELRPVELGELGRHGPGLSALIVGEPAAANA